MGSSACHQRLRAESKPFHRWVLHPAQVRLGALPEAWAVSPGGHATLPADLRAPGLLLGVTSGRPRPGPEWNERISWASRKIALK